MNALPRPVWPSRSLTIAAVLLALLVPLQARVIFFGKSLIQTNYSNPFDWRPLPANYGPRMTPHEEWGRRNLWPYANIRDPGAAWWQWEPGARFLAEAMRRREWPLWDPYVGAGTPAMANLVPAYFFPPFTALVALGYSPGLQNTYFVLLLYVAALFTALLVRQHDLGVWPSVFAGACVLTGGALNQNAGSFLEQTLACLPLTLYATRVMLDRPGGRRAALLALAYAATALSSFPPLLAGVFAMTALYALVAIAAADGPGGRRGSIRAAAWWTAGTLVSLGLVAAAYAPAIALGRDAAQVARLYTGAGLQAMPLTAFFQLLSPTLFGGVQVYMSGPLAASGQDPHLPYVGVACLGLALLARPGDGRRGWSLFLTAAGAAVVLLLKVFGVPPVQWIGGLPVLDQLHYAFYLGLPLGIALPILAACGLDALLRRRLSLPRAGLSAAVLLAVLEIVWRIAAAQPSFARPVAGGWIRDWRVLAVWAVVVAGVTLITAIVRPARRAWIAAGLLLAVVFGEGLYNTRYPKPSSWDVFARPIPYLQAIQNHLGSGRAFPIHLPAANSNEAFAIRSLGSMMAYNPPRVWELYLRNTEAAPSVFMREPARIPPEPLLDRAAISIIGTWGGHTPAVEEATRRGYDKVFDDGYAVIFARTSTGRARFASDYRVVSKDESRDLVSTLPAATVLLEEPPGVPSSPDRADDPAVAVTDSLNRVRLAVDAPRPGLVYLADSYMTGWSASVNGTPATILAANFAFRAVAVPAGRVEIEFRYWPPWQTAGLVISGISLMLWLGLVTRPSGSDA